MNYKWLVSVVLCVTPVVSYAGVLAWIEKPLAMHKCESKLSHFSNDSTAIHDACQCAWTAIDSTPHEKTALLERIEHKKHDPAWHNLEVHQALACIKSSGLYTTFMQEDKKHDGKGAFHWFRTEEVHQTP